MTRKKPWNRINLPVYSISSKAKENANMNIITYCTAVSMHPKRFVCGIYHGTKTLENVERSKEFVLQLLNEKDFRLVDLLGKKSGNDTNKIIRLQKRNALANWNDYPILKSSLAVIKLKVVNSFEGGDHTCFLCDMIAYKNLNDGEPLTLDMLRMHKMIRI